MLTLEEMCALRVCVGSAIGEYGVSETTDLALQALAKLESVQQKMQPTGGNVRQKAESKRKAKTAKSVGSPTNG